VIVSMLPMLDEQGTVDSVLGICNDVTALKQRESELRVALANQEAIFDAAGEGVVLVRGDRIVSANRALARMIGLTEQQRQDVLLARSVHEILPADDWVEIRNSAVDAGASDEAAIHEVALKARSGRAVWCQLTARLVDPESVVLVLTDISALKRREQDAWQQARHDPLTGLPNRRMLVEQARGLLAAARRQRRLAALLVIDLDNFKEINDELGHGNGDRFLQRVAHRFSSVLRQSDIAARTGGDEFVVALSEVEQPGDAIVVAEKLIAAASERLETPGGSELNTHASVGIALFPRDGQDFETLLANADRAMYEAKNAGKNQYYLATDAVERELAAPKAGAG
jgi:diguanylate cyclase (GGDEF)-like protein/PAS domain S-box-containing protein